MQYVYVYTSLFCCSHHPSQPPEGFSKEIWEDVCKIPCTDVLLRWISQKLVNQDVGKICEALSISRTASLDTSDDWKVYSDLLSTWLREQGSAETTYLSELACLLVPLNIMTLDAHSLHEATAGMACFTIVCAYDAVLIDSLSMYRVF